jgi:hypothetical protein
MAEKEKKKTSSILRDFCEIGGQRQIDHSIESAFRLMFFVSLRKEKYNHRVKREKTARTGSFPFLNRKPLPRSPKHVIGPYKGFSGHL